MIGVAVVETKRWKYEDSDDANKRDPAIIPPAAVRPGELIVSKDQLDHMMDCVTRSLDTTEQLASVAKQAQQMFETSANIMEECKLTLELLKNV